MSSSERWESSSNRFREVKEDEAPSWDVTGVKWARFLFLTVFHVWWGGIDGSEFRGPFDWGGGVMESARRWGVWEESGGGVRELVSGGGGVIWGLTLDGRSAKPGVVFGRSSHDGAVKLETWWGAISDGDRGRSWAITCGRSVDNQISSGVCGSVWWQARVYLLEVELNRQSNTRSK